MKMSKGIAPLIIILLVALGLIGGTTAGYTFREPIMKAFEGKTTADEIKDAVTAEATKLQSGQSKFELEGIASSIDIANKLLTVKVKSSTDSIKELRLTEAPVLVPDATTIQFGDQKAMKLADIPIDSKIHVGGTITDGKLTATKIEVQKEDGVSNKENEFEIGGTVKEVGTDKLVVTVKTANSGLKEEKGKDITVLVVIGTKIEKVDTVIALADIKVGDEVRIDGYKADLYTANSIEVKVKEEGGTLEEDTSSNSSDKSTTGTEASSSKSSNGNSKNKTTNTE